MIERPWILASNSPRRRELLNLFGRGFAVHPADVDETLLFGEAPGVYVSRLAEKKALAAAALSLPTSLILASDTTVADGNQILGKPADEAEAFEMLTRLRNRSHQVYTAICLYAPTQEKMVMELCVSNVPMRSYSNEEIEVYIRSGDPMDKAGGYAIQNKDFHPVEEFRGCFASVMGLPLCHLTRAFRKFGEEIKIDVPIACQNHLNYDCPIHTAVLAGEDIG